MGIKRVKNRGVTLVELLTVSTVTAVIAGMSFVHLKNIRIQKMMQEAKIQLSQIYNAQISYKALHRTFSDGDLSKIAFPSGKLRYNVGFNQNCTSGDGGHNHTYFRLCGQKFGIDGNKRTQCAFQTHDNKRFTPDDILTGSHADRSFKAMAIGDVFKDRGDGSSSVDCKMDKWSINQDGELVHEQDPLDGSSTCP